MSDDPLYREIILEHWQHPHNYGVLNDADIDERGDNPLCGDNIHVTAKVRDGKIEAIAFSGEGCAISKASASLFTDFIKGKPLEEVRTISRDNVLEQLGLEVTPARIKCALLPYATMQQALQ